MTAKKQAKVKPASKPKPEPTPKYSRDNLHELFIFGDNKRKRSQPYQAVRNSAYDFANTILVNVPESEDRDKALLNLSEAVKLTRDVFEAKGMLWYGDES
jgi:hypothetical protein